MYVVDNLMTFDVNERADPTNKTVSSYYDAMDGINSCDATVNFLISIVHFNPKSCFLGLVVGHQGRYCKLPLARKLYQSLVVLCIIANALCGYPPN